jgi:hypothetical protein
VAGGYLAGAPSLLWAGGVVALPMMPLFMPLFVWAYTAVFVFTALWTAHYALAALQAHRAGQPPADAAMPVLAEAVPAAAPAVSPLPGAGPVSALPAPGATTAG